MIDENTDTLVENTEDQAEQISQENENPTETDDPSVETSANDEENAKSGEIEFTPEQKAKINELVTSRLERQMNSLCKRYGVKDKSEFDTLVAQSQSYSVMKERYEQRGNELNELNEKLAFLQNNINPERYDDVRVYFKGKGIAFNNETLSQELATHPEWLNVVKVDTTPKTTIQTLGVDHEQKENRESGNEKMNRVFGLNY